MTRKYAVQKKVPVIPPRRGSDKYPFTTMKVGDSFKMDVEESNRVKCAANYYKNKLGHKYTMRKIVDKKGNAHIRLWRIA